MNERERFDAVCRFTNTEPTNRQWKKFCRRVGVTREAMDCFLEEYPKRREKLYGKLRETEKRINDLERVEGLVMKIDTPPFVNSLRLRAECIKEEINELDKNYEILTS